MIKLTEPQMYNLSVIIYNYKNNIIKGEEYYLHKMLDKLYSKGLIHISTTIKPTELGIKEYINNIKRQVFRNQNDKDIKIEIYKNLNNGIYEFIYFCCDKTGGGCISVENLMNGYTLYKQ